MRPPGCGSPLCTPQRHCRQSWSPSVHLACLVLLGFSDLFHGSTHVSIEQVLPQNSQCTGLFEGSMYDGHIVQSLHCPLVEVVHLRIGLCIILVGLAQIALSCCSGSFAVSRVPPEKMYNFFPGLFQSLRVVHLAAGTGAESVPLAPSCVHLRRPVVSRGRSGFPVLLVPRRRRSRPHILVATRTNMEEIMGQRISTTKMAHATE